MPEAPILHEVRAELDALDDALHRMLMQRAEVVDRLRHSGAKPAGTTLRPGREAAILRRLLATHRGPMPAAALVRIWREILAASVGQQGGFSVALPQDAALARLAAEHFGGAAPLRQHPSVGGVLRSVAAGEAGGILDTILMRLATFLEKNDALIRKVKGAMIYPLVIAGVAVIAVTVLLWKVIPVFETMFASVALELPAPTRFVIGLSRFINGYWWAVLGGAAAAVFLVRNYYATQGGKLVIDRLLLKLPVLGDVLRKSAVSRFTRTLGTLIGSGVSILDGLEITARTAGNRVIQDAILESRASIAGGDTIAAPLAKSQVFPPMVISMIAVGEQTGGLDEMLTKIADFYDGEVDAAVSALLSLLEPMMIVVLGVVVGGMVVSMYLPIFDMMNAVQ